VFADNGKVNTEVIVLCESASLSATKHLPRQLKGKGVHSTTICQQNKWNKISRIKKGILYLRINRAIYTCFLCFFLLATKSDIFLSSLWNERLGLLRSSSQLRQAHTGINSPERGQLRTLLTCQENINSNFQYERGPSKNEILILTRAGYKLPALVRNSLFN